MFSMRPLYYLYAGVTIGVVAIIGCANQEEAEPATRAEISDDWKEGLDENVVAALSQLSDEDRKAALEQRTCPVTDNLLGSMGTPVKVTVNGQEVFLCCDGCEDEIKNNPEKYLAKLNEN